MIKMAQDKVTFIFKSPTLAAFNTGCEDAWGRQISADNLFDLQLPRSTSTRPCLRVM